jgi:hypothetical protein
MRDESRRKVSLSLTGKTGEQSRRWKGLSASYQSKHMWIAKHYGKASACWNEACMYPDQPKRYEWANVSGQYLREVSDYVQLCPSCHRKWHYQGAVPKISSDRLTN